MDINAFEFQNIDDYNKDIQLPEPLFNINSIPYILFFFYSLTLLAKH